MSSFMREEYRKDELIYEEILSIHHPIISELNYELGTKLASSNCFNTASLVEEAVSACNGIKRSNKSGEDHVDGTDTKTASLVVYNTNGNLRWLINSVNTKNFWLRAVIYNPYWDELAYFLIPMHNSDRTFNFYSTGKGRIQGPYRPDKDSYVGIDQYRVKGFEEMCIPIRYLKEFKIPESHKKNKTSTFVRMHENNFSYHSKILDEYFK